MRLRRDFGALLNLIRAHTLLHRATRAYMADGTLVASFEDYAVVRGLIADLVADGVDSSVSPQIRETVEAVRVLQGDSGKDISQAAVATHLKLDKGATSRRIRAAVDRGYLKNLEDRRGRPLSCNRVNPSPQTWTYCLLQKPSSETVAQLRSKPKAIPSLLRQGTLVSTRQTATPGTPRSFSPDSPDLESTGWPIALPRFGPGEHTEFEQCHACPQGTWQRYGGVPIVSIMRSNTRETGGPKTLSMDCDRPTEGEDKGNHTKGEDEP